MKNKKLVNNETFYLLNNIYTCLINNFLLQYFFSVQKVFAFHIRAYLHYFLYFNNLWHKN